MTAPTLDDVRKMLQDKVRLSTPAEGHPLPPIVERELRCYRLALAALDDAEKWRELRARGWEIRDFRDGSVGVRTLDRDGTPYWIATGESYDDAIANAIDAARREGA